MSTFKVQIITPESIFYMGEASMVEYNTTEGYVGVMPGHIPMTQIIAPGKISIYEEREAEPKIAALHSGFIKIMPDLITIMAEIVEWKDDIDIERAKNSLKRATDRLNSFDPSIDVVRAKASVNRAKARLDVAGVNI